MIFRESETVELKAIVVEDIKNKIRQLKHKLKYYKLLR